MVLRVASRVHDIPLRVLIPYRLALGYESRRDRRMPLVCHMIDFAPTFLALVRIEAPIQINRATHIEQAIIDSEGAVDTWARAHESRLVLVLEAQFGLLAAPLVLDPVLRAVPDRYAHHGTVTR